MSMLHLSLACGERLSVLRFSVREALSALFTVQVVASSPDPCIDFAAILGEPASLRAVPERGEGLHGERLWSGVCSHIRQLHALDLRLGELGLSTYELTIVPRLWLLRQRTSYRVVQHLSCPELVGSLLDEWGLVATWRVDERAHPRFAYRVQYGETDFDFMGRILEESGVAYAFLDDDSDDVPRLVFSDAPHLTAPRRPASMAYVDRPMAPAEREIVTRVAVERHVRPGAVAVRDHDFLRPGWALLGQCRDAVARDVRIERYIYEPGAFLVEASGSGAPRHDDDYGLSFRFGGSVATCEQVAARDLNSRDESAR